MDLEHRLDPNASKKKQFTKIIEFLAAAPAKADYKLVSHADLLALGFLRRLLEVQTAFMILLRTFAAMYRRGYVASPIYSKGYLSVQEILAWSRTVGLRELYEAYCAYPDRALIGLFVDLKLEESFSTDEFVARVQDKPFTAEMILLDWGGMNREAEIEKLLRMDKIKSFRPSKQSDVDIKQSSWAKAFELWQRSPPDFWNSGTETTPLPVFPATQYIKMLPSEREFWKGPIAKAWHDGKIALLREGVPMLRGDREAIAEEVRQHRRNEWATLARREKIMTGQDKFAKTGPQAWRAEWDFSESASKSRRGEIQSEIAQEIPSAEASVIERQKGRWAYEYIIARQGDRGRIFLDELIASGNVAAASKAAGVSRVTGTDWRNQIRIELSRKHPAE